jgi:polyisoprenoid-binding protein YceI
MQGGLLTAVSADTRINRKDWGLTWNVALESGGWLVGDDLRIHIEFELVAPARELVAATA